MEIIEVNFANREIYLNHPLVLLDFWAEWCTACKAHDKIYEELKTEFGEKLLIGKINVADNRWLADEFGVKNIPHVILLKNGQKVLQVPGIQSNEHIKNQIKKNLL
jgi:thioredoxin 1